VTIVEESDALLVRTHLGDVRPEDVKIVANDRFLTIRGGAVWRSFELPDTVDGAAAIAIMNDGFLTVRIPRRAA
jgi:HSP20 family molecular chaperone IbpA